MKFNIVNKQFLYHDHFHVETREPTKFLIYITNPNKTDRVLQASNRRPYKPAHLKIIIFELLDVKHSFVISNFPNSKNQE